MLRLRSVQRKQINVLLASLCLLTTVWWITHTSWDTANVLTNEHLTRHGVQPHHPLDDVIDEARKIHQDRISRIPTSLHGAVYAYEQRRGRHPPPGFEKWYARASSSQAVIVESFFDQVYEDLEPFWGLEPAGIRGALKDWTWTLRIRNGMVKDVPQGRFRSRTWGDMINQVASDLPDMDVAINPLDEPRIFAPFTQINNATRVASEQRKRMMSLPVGEIENNPPKWTVSTSAAIKRQWIKKGKLWPYIHETCPPANEHPQAEAGQGVWTPSANWTTSKEICANHHWAEMHGSLVKPATIDISTELLPIFSAAKLQGSNDILLPPPAYYTNDVLFTGKGWFGDGKTSTPWHKKLHGLVWRGKATGGLIDVSTVNNSHRQRLVSMLNASHASSVHKNDLTSWSNSTEFEGTDRLALASWLQSTADVAFTDTMCSPTATTNACHAMSHQFRTSPPLSMKAQYRWKYLPDIDGNSLSGRFRAFLTSNSCVMKATIFKEWHDHRLMPWVHFVPLDITLRDLWSTMAYFLGFSGSLDHDAAGERIATEGRLWAEKVMRKEDMLLYVHRVLMEYGRICDDDRDRLGFTEDLQAG
ncbi:hypothetical protein MBLNU13_g03727t1 [Cladosporium sp. NU13]